MRLFFIAFATLLTSACGKSMLPVDTPSKADIAVRGIAPPANWISPQEISNKMIHATVPAGEWRMVRIRWVTENSGGVNNLLIVSKPAAGADPWVGMGVQNLSQNEMPVGSPIFAIAAQDAGRTGMGVFQFGSSDRVELAVFVGSSKAQSDFYLGLVELPPEAPSDSLAIIVDRIRLSTVPATLADELTKRPELHVGIESGHGGFAGTFARFQLEDDGEVLTIRSGRVDAVETVGAETGGAKILRQLRVAADESFGEKGVFSYYILARPQAEASQWSYSMQAPGISRDATGVALGASEHRITAWSPTNEEGTSAVAFGPPGYFLSGPAEAGAFNLTLDYNTRAGRDGGPIAGPADNLLARALYSSFEFYWGYIPADFETLYGWNVGIVENNIN
ncbi:MAG: hypothetical protein HYV18_06615 [Gammaproteobacteria bacterium]|nr:hypothetical protein [Gammaproteobacteria bacterium]